MTRAPRRGQRGFLLNPFRFGGNCAGDGFLWLNATLTEQDSGLISAFLRYGNGVFLAQRSGSTNDRTWRSTNGGRNFSMVLLGGTRDVRNVLHVGGDVWLMVLGNSNQSNSVLRSTDGGQTWSVVVHGASGYWYGNAVGAGLVRLARYNTVNTRVSADQGATWSDGPALPAALAWRSMAYFDGYWYINVTGSSTIYRLEEATGIWTEYTALAGATANNFYPANDKLFFTTAGGLYVSSDGGATAALAASTVAWGSHQVGQVFWNAADGFYFCLTRADNSSPNVMRASYDGDAWFEMGSAPPLPLGTYNGVASAWDGTTMVAGGPKGQTTGLYYGECA